MRPAMRWAAMARLRREAILAARPVYHHNRASIEAHLTIRVRRPRRLPVDREHHRLVDPQVRQDRTPLPHDHNPGRRSHHHRRRPPTRRPPDHPRHRLPHALNGLIRVPSGSARSTPQDVELAQAKRGFQRFVGGRRCRHDHLNPPWSVPWSPGSDPGTARLRFSRTSTRWPDRPRAPSRPGRTTRGVLR